MGRDDAALAQPDSRAEAGRRQTFGKRYKAPIGLESGRIVFIYFFIIFFFWIFKIKFI
jgi:uncharacterized membrane protein